MNKIYDCVIIGAGISGMTASIYLKRYNLNVLVLENNVPGGQIVSAPLVENYPGYKQIEGYNLANNIYEQMKSLNVEYKYGTVTNIKLEDNIKIVQTDKEEYSTKTVLIATGRVYRKLNLPDEQALIGKGISYCATCDGMFFKDKVVAVVGGGNSALEEGLYLAELAKKIYIINRSNELKGDNYLQTQVKEKDNIEILYNEEITKLNKKDNFLESIDLKNKNIIVDGIFIYIGLEPNTKFLNELPIELENNFIIVDKDMKTSINGIYASGDVIKKELYQLITSASEGAIAASSIKKFIEKSN